MRANLHLLVLAFLLGALTAVFDAIIGGVILILLIIWLIKFQSWKWRGGLLFLFIFGFTFYYNSPDPPLYEEKVRNIRGTVVSPVTQTPSTIRVTLQHETSTEKSVLQYLFNKQPDDEVLSKLKYGAVCDIKGLNRSPDSARNPGQFDYKNYLFQKGIYSEIIIESSSQLNCNGASFFHKVYMARQTLIDYTAASVDDRAYPWVSALVFGDSAYLDTEVMDWFRDFNLSHLLAISGLHVGLFIGGLFFLLYRTGFVTIEKTRLCLFIVLPGYCFLAGAEPSVIRASIMAMLLIGFTMVRYRVNVTDVLAVVAFFLLCFEPAYLFHLGFQFSFLVTFALLLSKPLLLSQIPLTISAIISMVSQLAILPIQLNHFYEFNPLSLILNIVLVPYFSLFVIPIILMLVIMCWLLPSTVKEVSELLVKIHEGFLQLLISLSDGINIQWTVGELPVEWGVVYLFIFAGMMKKWGEGRLIKAFAYGVIMVILLMVYCFIPYFNPYGKVTMLDVGQGDSFVIELPYRRGVVMVDAAGPSFFSNNPSSTADHIIEPFLKSNGIRTIDALFVSHKDQDHSGSVDFLNSSMDINHIFVSPFYEQAEKKWKVVKKGDTLHIHNYQFFILHPGRDTRDENNNSLVIYTELGGRSWLFTGDISKSIEGELLKDYPELSADVLKVGHHGSDTSTGEEWLRQTQPEAALVSAGENNRYGHPHQVVMESLEKEGVDIYRTDIHGAVQYLFKGEDGTFYTELTYNAERN
ncbi:DNA internalization-related competence protein ComEC/Rec2 [Halobacillus sp. Marseille-P3879]|uniref:DNA internalization-related competence protein ComEC/Rec2 n=1 Tax=Halobacillus sp. Marseille-P3879 TaxID=2045014 RepID=UPI000C7A0C14|nr:DNA internalization-related competence protein ComEC/Rec2 [Halobacillus sp. Marseille-P3879]